jgi:hypothetical protein
MAAGHGAQVLVPQSYAIFHDPMLTQYLSVDKIGKEQRNGLPPRMRVPWNDSTAKRDNRKDAKSAMNAGALERFNCKDGTTAKTQRAPRNFRFGKDPYLHCTHFALLASWR